MSEFKGTKGVWYANPKEQFYNGSKNTFQVEHGNDGECIAEVVHGFDNAKIIASAPELLETLSEFTDKVEMFVKSDADDKDLFREEIEKIRQLIKKATN